MTYSSSDYRGTVNNLSFNQDHGLFSCAMDDGIRIYNVEPLREKLHLDSSVLGSVSLCEMYNRTNIVAIVGGGPKTKYAENTAVVDGDPKLKCKDNTVLVWDNLATKFVAEVVCVTPVLSVRLKKDRLFAAECYQVHVVSFPNDPRKLHTFNTGPNPRGLLQVSPFPSSERQVLVSPGSYTGSIQIVDLSNINSTTSGAPIVINAHRSEIAYIALNQQGTLVATASVKGTLIRVFDTASRQKVVELRRGSDTATLYCINFSSDSDYLCASSDKGTVHIFALREQSLNKRLPGIGKLSASWVGSYVSESQWAFANFTVQQENQCICAFGPNSSVYAVCKNGLFYKYVYTSDGSCNQDTYNNFLESCEDYTFQ